LRTNVSKHNALFRKLTEKGKSRVEDGGLTIVQPLDYQANSTYQRYSGFDVLNINAVDVLTAAEYPWRQVAVNVAVSGLEMRTNSGENRIINFVKAKVKNAHALDGQRPEHRPVQRRHRSQPDQRPAGDHRGCGHRHCRRHQLQHVLGLLGRTSCSPLRLRCKAVRRSLRRQRRLKA
jgi:hypothetical protein